MQNNSNDSFPGFTEGNLVPLTQAGALFPVPVSASSLQRFWRQGVRGNRLKTVLLFGRRYTTLKEIQLFIKRSLVIDDDNGNAMAYPDDSPSNREVEMMRKRGRVPLPGQDGAVAE